MSSNLATSRLLARLPSTVTVVEIADDIYAVAPTDVAAVRTALADQPQIDYFLSRNLRASQVVVNETDVGWSIYKEGSQPPEVLYSFRDAPVMERKELTPGQEYTVNGFYSLTVSYRMGLAPHQTERCVAGPLKFHVTHRAAGNVAVGRSYVIRVPITVMRIAFSGPKGIYEVVQDPATLTDVQAYKTYPIEATPNLGGMFVEHANPTVLKKDLVVICGPSVVDYGEVFPGMQWFTASFENVATRMTAVTDYTKTKTSPTQAEIVSFETARDKMLADKGGYALVFKGSPNIDPVHLWPLAYSSFGGYEGVEVDNVSITEASKSTGKAQWEIGRWCCTVYGGAQVDTAIAETMAKHSGPITVKASGLASVHVQDSDGTVEMGMAEALSVVKAARASNRTVTIQTAPFEEQGGFDKTAFDLIKAAAVMSVDEATTGAKVDTSIPGNPGKLGEAICTRLLSNNLLAKDEEQLFLPFMTPQYFWSKLARE